MSELWAVVNGKVNMAQETAEDLFLLPVGRVVQVVGFVWHDSQLMAVVMDQSYKPQPVAVYTWMLDFEGLS